MSEVEYHYVIRNGLQEIRKETSRESDKYFQYYYELIVIEIAVVLFVFNLIVVIMGSGIIIPIIFKVRANIFRILAIFGYINVEDIRLCHKKCQLFMEFDFDKNKNVKSISAVMNIEKEKEKENDN